MWTVFLWIEPIRNVPLQTSFIHFYTTGFGIQFICTWIVANANFMPNASAQAFWITQRIREHFCSNLERCKSLFLLHHFSPHCFSSTIFADHTKRRERRFDPSCCHCVAKHSLLFTQTHPQRAIAWVCRAMCWHQLALGCVYTQYNYCSSPLVMPLRTLAFVTTSVFQVRNQLNVNLCKRMFMYRHIARWDSIEREQYWERENNVAAKIVLNWAKRSISKWNNGDNISFLSSSIHQNL